jgi:hypothetical protein
MLVSHGSYWFQGLIAGLSLFVEDKRRREEVLMYVMARSMESSWVLAREKGWAPKTGNMGDTWVRLNFSCIVHLITYIFAFGVVQLTMLGTAMVMVRSMFKFSLMHCGIFRIFFHRLRTRIVHSILWALFEQPCISLLDLIDYLLCIGFI